MRGPSARRAPQASRNSCRRPPGGMALPTRSSLSRPFGIRPRTCMNCSTDFGNLGLCLRPRIMRRWRLPIQPRTTAPLAGEVDKIIGQRMRIFHL